jgi:hypothetical protein
MMEQLATSPSNYYTTTTVPDSKPISIRRQLPEMTRMPIEVVDLLIEIDMNLLSFIYADMNREQPPRNWNPYNDDVPMKRVPEPIVGFSHFDERVRSQILSTVKSPEVRKLVNSLINMYFVRALNDLQYVPATTASGIGLKYPHKEVLSFKNDPTVMEITSQDCFVVRLGPGTLAGSSAQGNTAIRRFNAPKPMFTNAWDIQFFTFISYHGTRPRQMITLNVPHQSDDVHNGHGDVRRFLRML